MVSQQREPLHRVVVQRKREREMMKPLSELSAVELKNLLKEKKLSTAGSKAEMATRLQAANANTESSMASQEEAGGCEQSEAAEVARGLEDATSAMAMNLASTSQKEAELYRKEKELVEKELALAMREIEILRLYQARDGVGVREETRSGHVQGIDRGRESNLQGYEWTGRGAGVQGSLVDNRSIRTNDRAREVTYTQRINVTSIAELLNTFDGTPRDYEAWEGQIKLLKEAYRLEDDMAKILVGMRLKGRASEWFHSKSEHIQLSFDELLRELSRMFRFKQSKITLRKTFEERKWKQSESIHEYVHDKIILGNKISIPDDEILEYVIEGIPDVHLRDEARLHSFNDIDALLRAFEKISLSERLGNSSSKQGKRNFEQKGAENHQRSTGTHRGKDQQKPAKRCFNCGEQSHLGAECPSKSEGVKCFKCYERGHVAAKCPKKSEVAKSETVKSGCAKLQSANRICNKEVKLGGIEICALLDTGSDISLLSKAKYDELDLPPFNENSIVFCGVGAKDNKTVGFVETILEVDNNTYPIRVHLIPDNLALHDLLLGTDFIKQVELNIKGGSVRISPIAEEIPEVLNIQVVDDTQLDFSALANSEHKEKITKLVSDYIPEQRYESDLKMSIIVKDDEPVYQRARRLSMSERELVNRQIDEWIRDGIVQPSISEYASPIVLVKKKDGSVRICIDYRNLNRKIVKDRYPLPLIEDQLDALQGARVFSTLDLKNGFFHVSVEESSRKYTAFIVPDGMYEFLRAPFGLCNSSAIFQKYINMVFKNLIRERTVLVYMDDLIIPSNDVESGIIKVERVLQVAAAAGLQINWKKCAFLQEEVEFLGCMVANGKIRPSDRKTEAVRCFPEPTNVNQLQRYVGLTSYFRKFIRNYASIARPLTDMLRANVEFRFGETERNAFVQLKILLCEKPIQIGRAHV